MRLGVSFRRSIWLLAILASLSALMVFAIGGGTWRIAGLRLSVTDPLRPFALAIVAASFYLWRTPRNQQNEDGRWLLATGERILIVSTLMAVLLALAVGVCFGSYAATGADAFGYLSQARLWLQRDLIVEQTFVAGFDWPERSHVFSPLGYRPISDSGTIVPTYAPGLPMLMAAFRLLGENGPFFVVPILGSLAVACTYLLGRRATGSRAIGAAAAWLLLASPTFLAYVTLPMTDVAAAAGWCLVCVLALREPASRPLAAGLVASATLLVRPNLLLLALAPVGGWVSAPAIPARARIAWFAAGLLPGVLSVATINAYLYGSPLVSGYGSLADTYALSFALENLRNYGRSLIQTQTPLVLLAFVPLVAGGVWRRDDVSSSARACMAALMLLTFVSYVFYQPFPLWHFLRFLLPAFPALFVLMAAGIRWIAFAMPPVARAPIALYLFASCVIFSAGYSRDVLAPEYRAFAQRGQRAAEHVARLTPPESVIFAVEHSGSVRYYSGRTTARFDWLPADYLDIAIRDLRAKGRPAYIVVDDWEEPGFRERFASRNASGSLESWPLARVPGTPEVRLYELNVPP
ncbi:MAG TPA: hypothetical protein VJM31_06440 [Vicinamibacterales bacterium]|nr:hypothetical protein [Vicinamibacterales bacterium]